ncbi:hypothetical protein C9374_012187 [Naegleria lovaniensis]|uniref:Uncharacterized protein n=1 Tax=Naegleria lovaniensis TaxID=51637 RepID=A0AA88GDK7_NAELO|nr:uncharacterized protein C9374_013095 [Naegleria lovaniensis]XP_044542622.1 uncharacterized protein C9374_012187 [Naegleria lovaniensis]KAG2372888.1 hypothetical protein C9374_013095 [Naegleria lovaniensis]KAG2373448.1 hypothetical protein C9374_012187 [Naegleria lovaniensis]
MFTPPTPSSENNTESSSDSISTTISTNNRSSPIPLNRSPSSSYPRNSPPANSGLSRVNSLIQEKSSQTSNENQSTNSSSGGKRKKTLLKASPLISPLLLPQHSQHVSNVNSNHLENSLSTHHHGASVFGNSPILSSSVSSSLQNSESHAEHSVMSEFSTWEEVYHQQHVMMTGGNDTNSSSPVITSSSPSFPNEDSNFNNDQDHLSKRSSFGKSRKLTTFISKIFGLNLSNTDGKSSVTSSHSNRSKTNRLFNSGTESDEFFRDSAIDALDQHSTTLQKSSQNSTSNNNSSSNTSQQQRANNYQLDLESRQKSNFNQWFQDKSQTFQAQHLFEKEGSVYFFKKEIKPKKTSSLSYASPLNSGQNLVGNNSSSSGSNSSHYSSGGGGSSSGDLNFSTIMEESFQPNDIFVERFMSCKNEVVTIFEKSTKDSPVKHTFSWNQNVTYSIIPTERSFDTVILKQQKRQVRYYKNQYYLFEIRVEQGDYLYVMEPLILVGLVKTKEERDDWTDLFEIYSIYSSLNVFTEDEFTLASTLTREDKLRERLIQEYELFDEYQNEVREGVKLGPNVSSNLTQPETEYNPRLSTIDNPYEESKAFQKEMEKSYSHLIQSFEKNYLNSLRVLSNNNIQQEEH